VRWTPDGFLVILPPFSLLTSHFSLLTCYRYLASEFRNGVWRSPVARLLWEQEVPGSNPGAPIW